MCLAQGSQRSDTGKAGTHGPSVSSQALYHWATALPKGLQVIISQKYYISFFEDMGMAAIFVMWPGPFI